MRGLRPDALRTPPCCSAAACGAGTMSWLFDGLGQQVAGGGPPPPPPSGMARHPRPFGLLEPPPTYDAALTRPANALAAEAAAALLADDEAAQLPKAFDTRFRNPCWPCNPQNGTAIDASAADAGGGRSWFGGAFDASRGLCCLPYAHILGVSKCGTTDLHNRLSLHAKVLPSLNKGPHFWDAKHTLKWYVDLYAKSAERLASGTASRDAILLDASSNTLTYSGVGVRDVARPKPMVTLPHVMRWLQPNVRLVAMLREPGSRYYSAYRYYNKRYRIYEKFGPTGAHAFHKMVDDDIRHWSDCREDGSTARRCARKLFSQAEQLIKGLYAIFLESWLSAFPPSQLLIIRLEDYERDLEAHLANVLTFLRLEQPSGRDWNRMLANPRANRQARGEPMLENTRDVLRVFYTEHNEHLANLLGDPGYREWHTGPENIADLGTKPTEPQVAGVV